MDPRFAPESVPPAPPSADERSRERVVVERLRAAAGPDSRLRFDLWTEIALYDPEVGYYSWPGRTLGRAGDFYTAAHVSPIFAQALATRLRREWERLGQPSRFTILELGPGDGTLAADLLPALADALPDSARIEYRYVERSDALARRVGERVAPFVASGRVAARRLSSPGGEGGFRGVALANEVFDALPVRRLVPRAGVWKELWVRVDRDPMTWEEAPVDEPLPPPPLPNAADGTVLEVASGDRPILRAVADHLVEGTWIALDFGAEEGDLVARGADGTLAAYRAHRAVDPLSGPGLADLSAWVDFTRLRAHAREAGWTEVAYRSQLEALVDWELPELAERAAARAREGIEAVRIRLAAKNLLFGFSTFRVVEWRTGAGPGTPAFEPTPPAR